ncbi:unnamed protein product [Calicophoron daubneyi]
MASTAGTAVSKKAANQSGVIPCTCAEILAAKQDGDRFISPVGLELSQITILGVVRSVNESATRIEYEIDDYTGAYLPVKFFVEDEDVASGRSAPLRELSYVRVEGHVRNFQGTKHIIAFRVSPVTDMNELTTHMMEIIYVRMLHAKAKLDESKGSKGAGSVSNPAGTYGSGVVTNGLTVVQNQILSIVRAFVGERGIPVSQISEKLRGIPERQIRDDLDFLSGEGHVYSTVDDDHFRATEV